MPGLYTTIGPWTVPTFTLALGVAIAVCVGWGAARLRAAGVAPPAAVADAYLAALAAGLLAARLGHVILNWNYFADHLDEIIRLQAGGLDWHGGALGALAGLWLAARWRRLPFAALRDALTPAPPLLALAAWWGCWAAACGYGREVEALWQHPAFLVAESADIYGIVAPRYRVQEWGLALAGLALLAALGLLAANRLPRRRFWLALLLVSLGVFAVGFLRDDPGLPFGPLRLDQAFDLALAGLSLAGLARPGALPAAQGG